MLTCCSMSPTGQVLAFGCQGGSVHLHGLGPNPRVTVSGAAPQHPMQRPPAVQLHEFQPFSAAASYPPEVRMLPAGVSSCCRERARHAGLLCASCTFANS